MYVPRETNLTKIQVAENCDCCTVTGVTTGWNAASAGFLFFHGFSTLQCMQYTTMYCTARSTALFSILYLNYDKRRDIW